LFDVAADEPEHYRGKALWTAAKHRGEHAGARCSMATPRIHRRSSAAGEHGVTTVVQAKHTARPAGVDAVATIPSVGLGTRGEVPGIREM